jgi:hypothetical protein
MPISAALVIVTIELAVLADAYLDGDRDRRLPLFARTIRVLLAVVLVTVALFLLAEPVLQVAATALTPALVKLADMALSGRATKATAG